MNDLCCAYHMRRLWKKRRHIKDLENSLFIKLKKDSYSSKLYNLKHMQMKVISFWLVLTTFETCEGPKSTCSDILTWDGFSIFYERERYYKQDVQPVLDWPALMPALDADRPRKCSYAFHCSPHFILRHQMSPATVFSKL